MKDTIKETIKAVYEKAHKALDQLEALGLVSLPNGKGAGELGKRLPSVFRKWGILGNRTLDFGFRDKDGNIFFFTLRFFYDNNNEVSFSTNLMIHHTGGNTIEISGSVSFLTVSGLMLSMSPGSIQVEFESAPETPLGVSIDEIILEETEA